MCSLSAVCIRVELCVGGCSIQQNEAVPCLKMGFSDSAMQEMRGGMFPSPQRLLIGF